MVRTLTSTLTAAVSALTRRPSLSLSAEDHINHFATSITVGNTDTLNDACVAADGSIVRVQLTRGGTGFNQNFQFQRITDPTQTSQWQTWTTFSGGSGNMFQDGGCAVSTSTSTLRAFAQRGTGGNDVWVWTSTNNGVSWSGPVSVLQPPGGALTKGIGSAGNNDVFFLYDVIGGEAIGCSFYSAGWSTLRTWTLSTIAYGAGLAVWWDGTIYWIAYSDGYTLYEATYQPGTTTWTQLLPISPATSTAIGRAWPKLVFFDGLYQLVCIELDSGLLTGTVYNYPRIRQSADLLHWSNGLIRHEMTTLYGAILLKTTFPSQSRARYVSAIQSTVQLDQDFQQSDTTQFLDLSAHVLEYTREEQVNTPGKLTVTLENTNSILTSFVATYGTTYQPIGLNTSLVLSEGYKTGNPPTTSEVVKVGTYHINQLVFERSPDIHQIKLVGYDLSRNLDMTNRYQVGYSGQTLAWLVTEICARAGLFAVSLPGTAQMSLVVGAFILHAGQSYRRALDELCRVYWLEYFLDQNETMQFRELSNADPSVWTYAPEIETLTLGNDDLRGNHVIVSGKPPVGGQLGAITNGEAYDDTNAHVVGLERVLLYTDSKITTTAQCNAKASFLLQQEQRKQITHTVTLPENPALQLLDPIQLTDQSTPRGTGLSTTVRIIKEQVRFQAPATFQMTLELEGL